MIGLTTPMLIRHIFLPQIWYEVQRDILPDGELLAAPKVPLQLGDILNNSSQEHFSDRDTGES